MKINLQFVLPRLDNAFNWNSPIPEHVVRFQNQRVIQVYVCVCIKAIKIDINILSTCQAWFEIEITLIDPISRINPSQIFLVGSEIGIGNDLVFY
jgi:hypothetical protein